MSFSSQLIKTVSGYTFYDKIIDNMVFIEASQTWWLARNFHSNTICENTFI